ncbi:MAG: ABC transporter ATP-binding protein [Candidatus Delongbacteria bacterium]|nr:ABC transporter ATP-binding protein [Candidatus Delongbacteria bacterium]MBN2836708.1 ABC transporter ATP-binding protein [Candidatus Delongbacteria bacterium]
MGIFKRYVKTTKPLWKYIYVAISMMLIIVSISILFPKFIKMIIDDFIPNKDYNSLLQFALLLAFLYMIRMCAVILRNNRMLNFGYHYIYRLRNDLMHHFQLLSFRYYDRNKTGDIMNRMLDDVMNIEYMTTNALIVLVEDIVLLISVFGIMLYMDWRLTILGAFILPLYLIIHKHFAKKVGEKNREIRENYAMLSSEFHDSIAGVRVIRSFNLENFKKNRFNHYIEEDRKLRINTYTFNALFVSLTEYLTIIGYLAVFIGGGYIAIKYGTMTAGEVFAFYSYLGYLYAPVIRLSGTTTVIEAGLSSVKRVFEVLDTTPLPPEKQNPFSPVEKAKGTISFENVSFSYEDNDVNAISDLNFNVKSGETIALVGHSGSGKSTILNLITRFYDPTKGKITIDGNDLRDLSLKWIRKNIGLVLQEGFLFWGTIRENIRYGRIDATDEEVEDAARLAYAYDFIVSLPHGFDTPLGERGVKLSGGQRQRIAIARAILKNAPVMILDEATSALDNESEFRIQKAIESLIKERTTFIIAHRLTTIRNADRIFVLDNGQIVESGTHEELMELNGKYYKMQNVRDESGDYMVS